MEQIDKLTSLKLKALKDTQMGRKYLHIIYLTENLCLKCEIIGNKHTNF